MRVNWKRFILVFSILQVVFLCAGCSGTWLTAVSALLPALEAAITAAISFVAALEGKTVSASVSAAIQKIGSDVSAQIANVKTLIADYQAAASTGTLSQIQAVFQGIVANLANILSAFNVTDPASTSKFTQLVGLCVAAAQAIIALVPLVAAKLASGASPEELTADDMIATKTVTQATAALKETYVAIISQKTTSDVVNTALDSLPRTI